MQQHPKIALNNVVERVKGERGESRKDKRVCANDNIPTPIEQSLISASNISH
jgi:hypothetical protein